MKSRLVIVECAAIFSGRYLCGDYNILTGMGIILRLNFRLAYRLVLGMA